MICHSNCRDISGEKFCSCNFVLHFFLKGEECSVFVPDIDSKLMAIVLRQEKVMTLIINSFLFLQSIDNRCNGIPCLLIL